jgi:hypothetical protein
MRRHPSPLAPTVGGKPPQPRNERGTLGGISEIAFHASTSKKNNDEPITTNH